MMNKNPKNEANTATKLEPVTLTSGDSCTPQECSKDWLVLAFPIDILWLDYLARLLGVKNAVHVGVYRDGYLWDLTNIGVSWEPHKLDPTTVVGRVPPDLVRITPPELAIYCGFTVTNMGLLMAAKREGCWFPISGRGYEYCCYDIIPLMLDVPIQPTRTIQSTLALCTLP